MSPVAWWSLAVIWTLACFGFGYFFGWTRGIASALIAMDEGITVLKQFTKSFKNRGDHG